MADFVSTLSLRSKLEAMGAYVDGENFEVTYSRLASASGNRQLLQELETEVYRYFSELRLPPQPTVYDHLILSLRPKDVVATFNWDPFLIQAIRRCRPITAPPICLHLHGNVAIGHCTRHDRLVIGDRGRACHHCGERLTNSQLLFPVLEKGYAARPEIAKSWRALRTAIGECFLFTVFGYGAPTSDSEAIAIMAEAWGPSGLRSMEETEIIDLKNEDELVSTWKPFIHNYHCRCHTSFYDSIAAQLPRRSVEEMQRSIIDAEHIDSFPIPQEANWRGLSEWIEPLLLQERKFDD